VVGADPRPDSTVIEIDVGWELFKEARENANPINHTTIYYLRPACALI
jgi:hypothetical protein